MKYEIICDGESIVIADSDDIESLIDEMVREAYCEFPNIVVIEPEIFNEHLARITIKINDFTSVTDVVSVE